MNWIVIKADRPKMSPNARVQCPSCDQWVNLRDGTCPNCGAQVVWEDKDKAP